MKDLVTEIKEFIECTYECKFTGRVEVNLLNENTYNLRLTLNSFYVPLNISFEGTEEDFLEHVKDEIKKRRLIVVKYYSGYKNDSGKNY